MPTRRGEVTQPHIDTLLVRVASGEIAIPESSRPLVSQATHVRDLLDEPEIDVVDFATCGTALKG